MHHRRLAALGAALAVVLCLPAAASAHISVHPNTVPAGAFATLNVRVPGEEEGAYAWKVAVQMPPGFIDADTENVPGWSVETKTKKLAKPIETDDGPIDEEVSEIIWTGDKKEGKLENGTFAQFPLSVAIPESDEGKPLAFKTLEYYSNGNVAHWIGAPESEYPAPTINVTAKGGLIEEVAGGEAGPSASEVPGEGGAGSSAAGAESSAEAGGEPTEEAGMQMGMAGEESTATAASDAGSESTGGGSSNTLAIVALIVGALGLAVGVASVVIGRRSAVS
ncbi:MAG TPA: YcnI family protein [Solirubrobacterales bacterium]